MQQAPLDAREGGDVTTDGSGEAHGTDLKDDDGLLPELVAHLRDKRIGLRQDWNDRITGAQLLTAMTPEEISSEATTI